jgi:hypothetical protein
MQITIFRREEETGRDWAFEKDANAVNELDYDGI